MTVSQYPTFMTRRSARLQEKRKAEPEPEQCKTKKPPRKRVKISANSQEIGQPDAQEAIQASHLYPLTLLHLRPDGILAQNVPKKIPLLHRLMTEVPEDIFYEVRLMIING
jgi:hypothetical protein